MITDEEIDQLFERFINSTELRSLEKDMTRYERADAKRLFGESIRLAIQIHQVKEKEALEARKPKEG